MPQVTPKQTCSFTQAICIYPNKYCLFFFSLSWTEQHLASSHHQKYKSGISVSLGEEPILAPPSLSLVTKKLYIVVKWFPQNKKRSAEKYLAEPGGSTINCIFNSINLLCFLHFYFYFSPSKHPKSKSDMGQEETIVELHFRGLF